ncbi:unnamed protein product [Phytophthora lilii]|uniref:Unnamed protein product n=1 Tax=Phytophthora lilii TaxID=2077276 RepID=A0A9W6TF17_9STRA|nr:unnamed protein product [Phytophthora lilii]
MINNNDGVSLQSSPRTPPGVPFLEDSVWSDPGCSWDDSSDGYAQDQSGEATADTDVFLPPPPRRKIYLPGLVQSWVRLRWRLFHENYFLFQYQLLQLHWILTLATWWSHSS